jgi:hypothetical protein
MVVNFKARGISRGTRKLIHTFTLNLKKKKHGTQVLAKKKKKTRAIFIGRARQVRLYNF